MTLRAAGPLSAPLVSPRAAPPTPRGPADSGVHAPACFAFGPGLRHAAACYPASFAVYLRYWEILNSTQ